jgi:AcrR family transcriptional regulator
MQERILASVGRIITRDGLSAMGINSLARETGCDKVLIYRYFGSLEGVYEAFAARSDFWWTTDDIVRGLADPPVPFRDAMKTIMRRHADAIRSRPVTLAVLGAELEERTPLVVALESVRERRSVDLNQWIATHYEIPANVDFHAIGMLLGVAINYLAVRARKIRMMSGVPIKSERDWSRLLAAVDSLIDGVIPAT